MMQDAILFFDVHNLEYFPMIHAIAQRGFTPIINAGPMAEACRQAGLHFHTWESCLPPSLQSLADREINRIAGELGQAFMEPEVRRAFATHRGDFLSYISHPFVNQLIQLIYQEIGIVETCRSLSRRHRPRLMVLGCDNSPTQRSLVLAAAGEGIPTLQLAHGMLGAGWARVAGEMHTLYAGHLAAYGSRTRDFLTSQGNLPERIFLTGAPTWDQFYRPENRIDSLEAKKRLKLDPHRPVVLFTTSYVDGSSAFFPTIAQRFQAIHEAVLLAVAAVGRKVQLLVRPHPNEAGRVGPSLQDIAALDQAYREFLAARYGVQVHLLRHHKIEAMRAADVILVTGQSSVIPEAMILNRPVVSLPIFAEEPHTYTRQDGVMTAEQDGDLPEILNDLLVDRTLGEEIHRQQQDALPAINHGHDGKAAERAVELIVKLARPEAQARGEVRQDSARPESLSVQPTCQPLRAGEPGRPAPGSPEAPISPLNLLFVAHNFLPYSFAGTEIYTHDLARAMQRRGHQVSILHPRLANPDRNADFALENDYYEDLPVTRVLGPAQGFFRVRHEGLKPLLRDYFRDNPVDVVHIQHLLGLSVSFLEVLKELNIPTVLTLNDYWFFCQQIHMVRSQGLICEGPETIDKCVQCIVALSGEIPEEHLPHYFFSVADHHYSFRRALRLPDLVLCPSKFLLNIHRQHNFVNDNLVHLPQGANLFQPLPPKPRSSSTLVFSYLGTICYRKGLDILVEAFCLQDAVKAELHVYGGVAEQSYFDNIERKIPAEKKIVFHGKYQPKDLPRILAGTDVAVVPSRGENYPFVLREILHARVPVVAAAIAGIPEIVEDGVNGLLFEENNPRDLALKLALLIKQPELIQSLRGGIKPMKSMDQDAADIEGYYREILSRRAACTPVAARPASPKASATLKTAEPTPRPQGNELPRTPVKGLASIIIPVWNNLSLTRQCLESIREHTVTPHEIFVVDNGSSDGTGDFLAELEAAGEIQVITNGTNLGYARACNQGAREARGEYLIMLNNDTLVTPEWLPALVATAESNQEIAVVGAKLLYPDDTVQHAGVVFSQSKKVYHLYRYFHRDHPAVNKVREFQVVTAACLLIRTSVFFAAGLFDENFRNGFEDVDLCLTVKQLGYRLVYTPRCVVYHLESQTPGRCDHDSANSRYLLAKWQDEFTPDDLQYYQEDGLRLEFIVNQEGERELLIYDTRENPYLKEAREHSGRGDFAKALSLYKAALRFNPFDPRNRGMVAEMEALKSMTKPLPQAVHA